MAFSLLTMMIISAVMMAASFAMTMLMRPKFKAPDVGNKSVEINETSTESYLPVVYGDDVVGIHIAFESVAPDGTDNLYIAGALCHGEIEEVVAIYNDKELVCTWDGSAHGDVQEFIGMDGHYRYEDKWYSKKYGRTAGFVAHLGSATQTVDATLQGVFGAARYENERCGKHIAYLAVRLIYDFDIYPYGRPNITAKVKGVKVHDPRNVAYPNDAPAWSDNPVLCVLDYLTNTIYGLKADPVEEIDVQAFITAANYCDDLVTIPINLPAACKPEVIPDVVQDTYNAGHLADHSDGIVTLPYEVVEVVSARVDMEDGSFVDLDGTQYTYEEGSKDVYFTLSMSLLYHPLFITYTYSVAGGLSVGQYKYKVSYKTAAGETLCGAESYAVTTVAGKQQVMVNGLTVSASENVTKRAIYRTVANGTVFKLVADVEDNTTTTYKDTIPDASLVAVEPASDTSGGGTAKRFTCNGVVDCARDQRQNLEDLLSSCRGNLFVEGGKYSVYIRKATIAEDFELTEDNIIGDWRWSTPGVKDMVNIIKAGFRNPETNYEMDYRFWPKKDNTNQFLIDDNGFENVKEITLPFTNNRNMVDQMLMVIRAESRQGIVCSCTVKEEAMKLSVGNVVNVSHSTPGWVQKPFWVETLQAAPDSNIRVSLREYDATSYDYANIDKDPIGAPDTILPSPLSPREATNVAIADETYLDYDTTRQRMRVTYTEPASVLWLHSEVWLAVGGGSYTYNQKIDRENGGVFYIPITESRVEYCVKILSVSTFFVRQDMDTATVWSHEPADLLPPSAVTGFKGSVYNTDPAAGTSVLLMWNYVQDRDAVRYELRVGDSWDSATVITRTIEAYLWLFNVSSGTYTYRIKAVDRAGNYSQTEATATVTVVSASYTQLLVDSYAAGTFVDTEQYSSGDPSVTVLRPTPNYIANSGFESNTTGWTLATGWVRSKRKAYGGSTWSVKSPTSGTGYSYMSGGNIAVSAGKTYVFTCYVWCNVKNAAHISVRLDNGGTEVKSEYHPGDSKWHILRAAQTVSTPHANPEVRLKVDAVVNPGATKTKAYYDDAAFATMQGSYISPSTDKGSTVTKKYKLEYTTSGESWGNKKITVSVGASADNTTFVYTPITAQHTEVVLTGRYFNRKVEFYNTLPGEALTITPITVKEASVVSYAQSGANSDISSLSGCALTSGSIAAGVTRRYANTAITASLSINDTHCVCFADASGGSITVTLPPAANYGGKVYHIKRVDNPDPSKTVTIAANGAELIDDANTLVITNKNDSYTIISDSTGWKIL